MLRIFANEPATFEAQLPVDECVDRLQRVIEAARRSAPEDARPIGRASRRRVVLRPPPGRPRKLGIAYPTIFVGRLVPHHRGAALTGIFTVSRLGKLALSGWFIAAAFLLLNGGLDSLRSGASIDRLAWLLVPLAVLLFIAGSDVVAASARRRADIDYLTRTIRTALER